MFYYQRNLQTIEHPSLHSRWVKVHCIENARRETPTVKARACNKGGQFGNRYKAVLSVLLLF